MILHDIVLLYYAILYYIMLYYIILCYIILYYIILHLTFILLFIYNLFKGSNGKAKLERSRLWQLDNSRRKLVREADGGGLFSSDLCFL